MGKAEEFPWRLLVSLFIVFVGFTVLSSFEGKQTIDHLLNLKKETEVIEGIVIKAEKIVRFSCLTITI